MIRHPVDSSTILSVGHDPKSKVLHVEFRGRMGGPSSLYEYSGVTSAEHKGLMAADSHGSHFAKKLAHVKARGKRIE